MDSRQQFEEWYAEESKDWPPAITVCCKEAMWGTWQASRKAITIELPVIVDKDWTCTSAECESMRHGITLTKHKINAAGIRTK